tara:strand:- start:611 stop:907 length:297 start_codon:yes stop_codon:yes gene_type:complete
MVDFLVFHLVEIGGLGAILYLMHSLRSKILDTLDDLSIDLASALQGTIAEVASNVEPANPFQQLVLQWLSNQAVSDDRGNPAVEILKDEAGRFASKKD